MKIYHNGYEINIFQDSMAESPNEWEDESIFLVYDHRNFFVKRDGFDPEIIFQETMDMQALEYNNFFVFPVYAYIHSGVSLSLGNDVYPFNDRFDSSMRGFVLVEKNGDSLNYEYQRKNNQELVNKDDREVAEYFAKGCIESWNEYLSGEIYRMNILKVTKCKHCGSVERKIIDSCGSYYGNPEESGMIEEAKSIIDSYIKRELKERKPSFKLKKLWQKMKKTLLVSNKKSA